jgi:hypothetical protein
MRRAHDPGNDGEATTLGLKSGRQDRAELLANPTRHRVEEFAMMPGPGRLSGRGPVVAATLIPTLVPALVRPSGPILRFRLAALLAAQLFDFGTFTLMVGRHGIAAEMNPLVAQGFDAYGLPILVGVKFALVILLGSIVVLLGRNGPARRSIPGLAASITILAVIGGLVGGISNVLAG